MEGHYCRGGYVAAYKLEGQTCEADDTCEPTQSSDFALECINKVCRNKHASNAFIELPSIVDDSFVPEISADILPVVGSQTLKQVDEVFDETLMHKPMLAS